MPSVPTLRRAALFCAAAIAFGVCFVMLQEAIGSESPALGLLLMFYFMGLAKLANRSSCSECQDSFGMATSNGSIERTSLIRASHCWKPPLILTFSCLETLSCSHTSF
jgi:hypothetical protein